MFERPGDTGFPCIAIPVEARARRLIGLYEQRQEGLFMQRVKVQGGRITPGQLRTLAHLADRYTPGCPLHITTRQDVELHGLRPHDVPAVQRHLAEIGLTSAGACGDTLRNLTVCAGNGVLRDTYDVAPLADAIRGAAESLPFIRALPRKFKVAVCGCGTGCTRPWINDVALVARPDGAFRVIGAGSLGPRPSTGVLLYESVPASQAVPLAVAALRVFDAEGDREHRGRARLRHVRERMGEETFRQRLDEAFRAEVAAGGWPSAPLPRVIAGLEMVAHFHLPRGDITPAAAAELADAVEDAGHVIRIGLDHDLIVFGRGPFPLQGGLTALASAPTVVACPGITWCARAIANSREMADRILASGLHDATLAVRISGCPNDCAQAAVADIGLIGRVVGTGNEKTECFRLLAGGGAGRTPDLAIELHPAVPASKAAAVVKWLIAQCERAREESRISPLRFLRLEHKGLSATIGQSLETQEKLDIHVP